MMLHRRSFLLAGGATLPLLPLAAQAQVTTLWTCRPVPCR
jgi:hypothetical protein